MNVIQTLKTAIKNLFANKGRCLQTMLAMVIGVAGVVVVLVLGGSLLNFNSRGYDELAPGSFNTYLEQNANYPKAVMPADMEKLAQNNPNVIKAVSPLVWSMDMVTQLRNEDKIYETGLLYGVGESYLEFYPELYVQEGRFLQYMDIRSEQRVCVLGHSIAEELFAGEALGKTLKIWGENYTIVGVLADMPFSIGINGQLLIPYPNAYKIFGEEITSYNFYEDQYRVLANGVENMYETQLILQDMLREKTGGETGSVYEPGTRWVLSMYAYSGISELMSGSIYQYMYFCLLAAGVVLFIGGVGIMNVMLASVQERIKEIGIRKAFGATAKDIERQFTMEAVMVSLFGGFVGIVCGFAVSLLVGLCNLIVPVNGGYPYVVRIEDMDLFAFAVPILLVFVICVGIGVFFSAYPAQQAAKMEIVDAINSD